MVCIDYLKRWHARFTMHFIKNFILREILHDNIEYLKLDKNVAVLNYFKKCNGISSNIS